MTCVKRGESFRCVGDYAPSRAAVADSMRGIDTSDFRAEDWNALREQQSGQVAFDVDVDADGRMIWTPSSS